MRWADLVLSYIRVLAWPVVVISAIYLFRAEIRKLILSARRLKAFGAEAEFAEIDDQVEYVERELESVEPSTLPRIATPPEILTDKTLIESLTSVDFSGLDADDPVEAAIEMAKRLNSATIRVLSHFEIPADLIDSESAGIVMAEITGDSRWIRYLELMDRVNKVSSDMSKVRPSGRGQLTSTAKDLIGVIYRAARILPTLIPAVEPSTNAVESPTDASQSISHD